MSCTGEEKVFDRLALSIALKVVTGGGRSDKSQQEISGVGALFLRGFNSARFLRVKMEDPIQMQ